MHNLKDLENIGAIKEEKTKITSKELLDNKYKEEKNGDQHFSKVNEDNYVWNFVYDDFGRTKLTTEPDKATHLVYTMEGKDNPQLLKISEREILDYKKGENNELSKKKKGSLESSIISVWTELASKVKEGSKEEYQKFFNSALKKFKIDINGQ